MPYREDSHGDNLRGLCSLPDTVVQYVVKLEYLGLRYYESGTFFYSVKDSRTTKMVQQALDMTLSGALPITHETT